MYISIYTCSPVKQKNTGIFPKKSRKQKNPEEKQKRDNLLTKARKSIPFQIF